MDRQFEDDDSKKQDNGMYVVFFFPLVFSVVATWMFLLGDYSHFTKGFFVLLTAGAIVLQFVPAFQMSVHFLVPFFMQLFVCICWYFASQFE